MFFYGHPQNRYWKVLARVFEEPFPETVEERKAFLEAFEAGGPVAAFVTMGGLFTEGIDLAGEKLVGAVIVGVGLPQVNPAQEALRAYYQQALGDGFAYAYRYPGMQKVAQAAAEAALLAHAKGRAESWRAGYMNAGRVFIPDNIRLLTEMVRF